MLYNYSAAVLFTFTCYLRLPEFPYKDKFCKNSIHKKLIVTAMGLENCFNKNVKVLFPLFSLTLSPQLVGLSRVNLCGC